MSSAMFDNRWENWASDFAESFAASGFQTSTRDRIPEILHEFGIATRQFDPEFPDSVAPGIFARVFAEYLPRLALAPSVRDDLPEVVARFLEFLQDDGRLGDGYAWAKQVRQCKVAVTATQTKPSGPKAAPIRNTPQTAVGRNDPCPCGSGKKYKKCCYA